MKHAGYRKTIRFVSKLLLLGHILEFIYWLAAIVIMIYLIQWLSGSTLLMYAGTLAYVIGVVALYFTIVKRVKMFFC
jgi:hypothetical protein